jgi:autotransporter-associated beta strand protein
VFTVNGIGYSGQTSGSGVGTGAIRLESGNVVIGDGSTPFTLNSAATLGVDGTGRLIVNGTIPATTSTLNKVGTGILEFQGHASNLNSGTTTINEGTIRLNKRPGAVSGAYVVAQTRAL